jgi:curved DNA-binding protein CbpA
MRDFYAILGVPRDAMPAQIRARFLELTRQRHPDRFQGDEKVRAETEFQEITQAFNNLSSPHLRRQHDLELRQPQKGAADPSQVSKVYLQRGVKAYKTKNFREAADNFRRAAEVDPENGMAWHHLARACSQERRYLSQARKAIEEACRLEPMKVSYLKLAGEIFREAGDKAKAIHYYRQAVQWGGDEPEIQTALEELTGKKKSLLGGLFGRMGG